MQGSPRLLIKAEKEDGYHAVMTCPHARRLRQAMRRIWQLPAEETLGYAGPDWFLVMLDSGREEGVEKLALILWRAWTVRNKVTRAGEALSIDRVFSGILKKLGKPYA
jgi:hypothetical protein